MPNKEKRKTSTISEISGTYRDKRKDYIVRACFDNSESILETAKKLIKNEIVNSYLNKNTTKWLEDY